MSQNILIAYCKSEVNAVRMLWSYCSLALNHHFKIQLNILGSLFQKNLIFDMLVLAQIIACYTIQAKLLTHCGLVTPYGDTDLGPHWLR